MASGAGRTWGACGASASRCVAAGGWVPGVEADSLGDAEDGAPAGAGVSSSGCVPVSSCWTAQKTGAWAKFSSRFEAALDARLVESLTTSGLDIVVLPKSKGESKRDGERCSTSDRNQAPALG